MQVWQQTNRYCSQEILGNLPIRSSMPLVSQESTIVMYAQLSVNKSEKHIFNGVFLFLLCFAAVCAHYRKSWATVTMKHYFKRDAV